MSGHTKRILGKTLDLVLFAAACAAAVCFLLVSDGMGVGEWLALAGWMVSMCLMIPAAVHELGHLLFGLITGMRCTSATLSFLRFSDGKVTLVSPSYAGKVEAFPKGGKNMRMRFFLFSFGGIVVNFLVGLLLLALFFFLPYHPALLFCGLLSPMLLYEGIHALLPLEDRAGKSDGAVIFGLLARRPEEEVTLRVLEAEGTLYRGEFSEIEASALFQAPVVREDFPAFHALCLLRAGYLLDRNDEASAQKELGLLRMREGISAEVEAEIGRYEGYFSGDFHAEASPLHGWNVLDAKLVERLKN